MIILRTLQQIVVDQALNNLLILVNNNQQYVVIGTTMVRAQLKVVTKNVTNYQLELLEMVVICSQLGVGHKVILSLTTKLFPVLLTLSSLSVVLLMRMVLLVMVLYNNENCYFEKFKNKLS